MANIKDIEKLCWIAVLLEDFCSETSCRVCPIVKLCK